MIHVITLPDLEYVINKLNSESFIQSKYQLFLQIYNYSKPMAYFFRFCPWIYQRLVVKMLFICGDVKFRMSNGRVWAIIWHDWWSPCLRYDCISSIQLTRQQRKPLWRLKLRLVYLTPHASFIHSFIHSFIDLVILTHLSWRRNGGIVKLFKLINNNNNNNKA